MDRQTHLSYCSKHKCVAQTSARLDQGNFYDGNIKSFSLILCRRRSLRFVQSTRHLGASSRTTPAATNAPSTCWHSARVRISFTCPFSLGMSKQYMLPHNNSASHKRYCTCDLSACCKVTISLFYGNCCKYSERSL